VTAQALRKFSFWTGIVAAAIIPLVPFVYRWVYPPKVVNPETSLVGIAVFALDLLDALGDGISIMLWMAGLAAVAVAASLIAFIAAWHGREARRAKFMCWLPALMAALAYGVLVAIGA